MVSLLKVGGAGERCGAMLKGVEGGGRACRGRRVMTGRIQVL